MLTHLQHRAVVSVVCRLFSKPNSFTLTFKYTTGRQQEQENNERTMEDMEIWDTSSENSDDKGEFHRRESRRLSGHPSGDEERSQDEGTCNISLQ